MTIMIMSVSLSLSLSLLRLLCSGLDKNSSGQKHSGIITKKREKSTWENEEDMFVIVRDVLMMMSLLLLLLLLLMCSRDECINYNRKSEGTGKKSLLSIHSLHAIYSNAFYIIISFFSSFFTLL